MSILFCIRFFPCREVNSEIEKVRDRCQAQKDILRELTVKEGHVNRQVNSRQEKLAKMQIQHKVEVEGLKENMAARER